MAMVSTTETGVYRDKADYFVNGKKALNATILRQKGRGRVRAVWQGSPWEVDFAMWKFGCIINDGAKWYVELTLADGMKHGMTLNDFLKIEYTEPLHSDKQEPLDFPSGSFRVRSSFKHYGIE